MEITKLNHGPRNIKFEEGYRLENITWQTIAKDDAALLAAYKTHRLINHEMIRLRYEQKPESFQAEWIRQNEELEILEWSFNIKGDCGWSLEDEPSREEVLELAIDCPRVLVLKGEGENFFLGFCDTRDKEHDIAKALGILKGQERS